MALLIIGTGFFQASLRCPMANPERCPVFLNALGHQSHASKIPGGLDFGELSRTGDWSPRIWRPAWGRRRHRPRVMEPQHLCRLAPKLTHRFSRGAQRLSNCVLPERVWRL